ncbi:hypothetical protein ACWDUL_25095 [Nocardia niigatensis]|uniref:hypothetical protein n=1 Tax=Nocardia niigatensis TaxID=209249 RepID=UPI00030E1684|nr:hypothetical protein [Nocardia niigatensis]
MEPKAKRLLILAAIILAASTYTYALAPGHSGAAIALGAVLTLFFIGKAMG